MIINRHNSHVIINNETLAAILNFRFHGILIISNILTQYEKNMIMQWWSRDKCVIFHW